MTRFAAIKTSEEKIDSLGDKYQLGHHDDINYAYRSPRGLSQEIVRTISKKKNEPEWMLKNRLKALSIYEKMPLPGWGGDLKAINFDEIYYYLKPMEGMG